ncbi:MAG: RidA family protein [Bdellovibrionales bacterium]|nr:RidA family protein [Bdellovibrionales bacterium]
MSEIYNSQKAPEPVGAYPHARQVGNLVFLSGVGPRKKGTHVIPGVDPHDIAIQTQSVIENVQTILQDCGLELKHIVDIQVFLTNMKRDFATFNQVYNKTFAVLGPTRTTIEVGSLPTPIAVEFKVIAAR